MDPNYDAVNPPHYQRGPIVRGHIGEGITMGHGEYEHSVQCIEVMEHIRDPRLATAFRYLWRVAFGGKLPESHATQHDKDSEDIDKAIWYLKRFVDFPVDGA